MTTTIVNSEISSQVTLKISVILPSFNHCKYVAESVTSILEQTFSPELYELILIDDGSTDNSRVILRELVSFYENKRNITYIEQDNIGVSRTLNKGLAEAKGKYIVTMASDDRKLPNCLEQLFTEIEDTDEDACLVYSNGYMIDEVGTRLEKFSTSNPIFFIPPVKHELYVRNFLPGPGIIYKHCCIKEVGGFNNNLQMEDWDLYGRLAKKYKFKGRKNLYTFEYRYHGTNTRSDLATMKINMEMMALDHPEFYKFYKFKTALRQLSTGDIFSNVSFFNLYLLTRLLIAYVNLQINSRLST